MDSINFITPGLEENQLNKKLITYKAITLIMWLCCMSLFVLYNFQSSKNKALGKIVEESRIKNNVSSYENTNNRRIVGMNTLNKFMLNLQGNIPYKAILINDRKVDMEVSVDSRSKFYEILDLIENKFGYRILYLSTPVSAEGLICFKITIEVT